MEIVMGIWNAKPNIRRMWRVRKPDRRVFGQATKRAEVRGRGMRMQRGEFYRWAVQMKDSDRRGGVLVRGGDFYFQPCFERRLPCNA